MKLWGIITTSFLLSSMLIGCTATTTAETSEHPPVEVEAAPTPTAELYIRETIQPEEVEAPPLEPTPTPEPEVEEVTTDEAPDAEPEPVPVEEAPEEAPDPDTGGPDSEGDGGAEELTEEAPEAEPVNAEPAMHLWGVCTITHYCAGSCCCGEWAGSPTASGVWPQVNHTVSCGDLPFGTRLMINGQEYVVEDTGVSGMWVDIFVGSHEEALQRGMYQAEVYILE